MLAPLLLASILATLVAASPIDIYKRHDSESGLTWISKDSSLPKIMLYNTGDGTILSGSCYGRLDNLNYGGCVGGVSPEGLIAETPEVLDIAQIAVYNSTPKTSSSDATSMRFLDISLNANRRIYAADSDIVGVVMIHGTTSLASHDWSTWFRERAEGLDPKYAANASFKHPTARIVRARQKAVRDQSPRRPRQTGSQKRDQWHDSPP